MNDARRQEADNPDDAPPRQPILYPVFIAAAIGAGLALTTRRRRAIRKTGRPRDQAVRPLRYHPSMEVIDERTGTRFYDALLTKCRIRTDEAGFLPIEELQQFRADEAAHIGVVG